MCGIVGYISLKDDMFIKEKQHFMHFALTLDSLRGYDSTGIITVNKRFQVHNQRSLMPGDKYVHSKHYRKNVLDSWAKIGHNRAATRGSIKLQNTHPFKFGPVSLVHNGTLAYKGSSLPTFDQKFEVDSMQIAHALSVAEVNEVKDVLEKVDGSFAIVWADQRDESINMARNMDRPMHFAFNRPKEILWFMSDGLHLKTVNKSFWNNSCSGEAIFQMDKHKILKFRKGKLVPEVTSFSPFIRPLPTVRPIMSIIRNKGKKGGGDQTALERATNRWKDNVPAGIGPKMTNINTGSGLRMVDMRITVNSKKRKLLLKHLLELRVEYDMKPTEYVEFKPLVKYEQPNGRFTVLGDIIHREWADSEWDGIIYNVRTAMAKAYMERSWVVNPVGVSRPHQMPPSDSALPPPSLLCSLVNCDWDKHKADILNEDDEGSPILVTVGNKEIPVGILDKMLENGCMQCTAGMNMDDVSSAVVVNEGRDLICGGCISTLNPKDDFNHTH